jgi:hypothetical protein
MKHKLLFLAALFPAGFCFSQSITPEVIGSAGDFYSNSSGMIQWTVGETMVETYGNASNFITQGFHQPDDFTTHISVQNTLNIHLFPNPASDHFTLEFSEGGNYTVEMFNALGQQVLSKQLIASPGLSQFQIPLSDFSNGIYFVTIKRAGTDAVSGFKLNKIS